MFWDPLNVLSCLLASAALQFCVFRVEEAKKALKEKEGLKRKREGKEGRERARVRKGLVFLRCISEQET